MDAPAPPLKTEQLSEDQITPVKFLIGSWFLYESFAYCTQPGGTGRASPENEWMHYATGVVVSDLHIIDRMVTFPLVAQSSVYVEGDHTATRDVLIQMSERGYMLHAVCHSHPGRGPNATHPSATDIDHQLRLERGGYLAISGIYSRDGYVRFFSVRRPFQLEVYGQGVEQLGANIFHLTEGR